MLLKLCARLVLFVCILQPVFSGRLLAADEETNSVIEQIPQRWLIEVKSVEAGAYNDSLKAFVRTYNPGGVIYKSGGLSQIAEHQAELQRHSLTPLLVGVDLTQGGLAGSALNSWVSLAATQDSLLIAQAALADALEIKKHGAHLVLLDPFRLSFLSGFGEKPAHAIATGQAYIAGMKAAGLNVIIRMDNRSQRLPYQEEISILSELEVKGLDISSLAGAGLAEPRDVHKFLKKEKYRPLTLSNWPDRGGLDDDMKRPLSDLLLLTSLDQAEGVFDRRINEKRQALAVLKIAQWKMGELVKANLQPSFDVPAELLQAELAGKSAMLLRNAGSLIPFQNLEQYAFAGSFFGQGDEEVFFSIADKYAPVTRYRWTGDLQSFSVNEHRISHFGIYLAAIDLDWYRQRSDSIREGLKEMLLRLQEKNTKVVLALFGSPEAVLEFGGFDVVSYHPENTTASLKLAPQLLFGAYAYQGMWQGPSEVCEKSLHTVPLARLKYEDPWRKSLNIARLSEIDSLVEAAILEKAIPGCQVLVAKGGSVLYEKSFGYLSYDSLMPVTENTMYDLASLTKVTATLQMMMKLVEEGKIDLNERLGSYLPETWGTGKENLVISDILLHRAGLKPYIPFWEFTFRNKRKNILDPGLYDPEGGEGFPVEVLPGMYTSNALKDSVWQWTLKSDLMNLPSGKTTYDYKYSDLGFIIVQRLVETVSQTQLDQYVYSNLYKPLGLGEICFQPLCNYSYEQIAPTELDYYFRKDMVWGTVHDQNAALMGGIAGHAGLFGTANSLAVLLQMHLQKGYYGGRQYYKPETIELFTQRPGEGQQRALGWDLKDPSNERKNVSFYSSETTYGHTGFTGTAVWVDPAEELIYIFLSNRVHPDANNYKLVESNLRTRIQDVIYQSLKATTEGDFTSGD